MNVILIALGALVFVVSLAFVERHMRKDAHKRAARQWEDRERQLNRRRPIAPHREILDRRARRG
jgi:hypothetical protein